MRLININIDAEPRSLRDFDYRQRAGLRRGRILNERAGIGIARGYGSAEWSAQFLIRLQRANLLQIRLGDGGVGVGLVGILLRDHFFFYERCGAVGDEFFVVRIGNCGLILLVSFGRFDHRQNLVGMDKIAFVDADAAHVAADLGIQNCRLVGACLADQPDRIRACDFAGGGDFDGRSFLSFGRQLLGGGLDVGALAGEKQEGHGSRYKNDDDAA